MQVNGKGILYLFCIICLLTPGLGISTSTTLGKSASDSNAVHKWETWDSDLFVTGTTRAPIIKAGADLAPELVAAGLESYFTGIYSVSNTTQYPLVAISQGNPADNPAGVILSYGEHSGGGGSNVFSVYRICNITNTGYCNTGPIAGFGDMSNTLFPNQAVDISSDISGSSQVLRVNGFFMDPYRPVVYIANMATSPALTVDDGTMVCTNLNADLVDGYHLDQDVSTVANPIFGNVTSTGYFVGDGSYLTNLPVSSNATYSNDSDMVDGLHAYEIFNTTIKVDNATYSDNSDMVDGLHANEIFNTTIKVDNTTYSDNSDMLDGLHANEVFNTTIKVNNATYADDSNTVDTHHWSEVVTTKVNNATYADTAGGISSMAWSSITGFPTTCGYNQCVKTIGSTLTCSSSISNADTVDYFHLDQGVSTGYSPSFKGVTLTGQVTPYFKIYYNSTLDNYMSLYPPSSSLFYMAFNRGLHIFYGDADGFGIYNETAAKFYVDPNCVIIPDIYRDTSGIAANVYIDENGHLYRSTLSSEKYKSNISTLNIDSSKIYDLQPKSFVFNTTYDRLHNTTTPSFGYIAEDVNKTLPELVIVDNGTITGVNYPLLSVLLNEELNKERSRNDDQQSEIAWLTLENQKLKEQLTNICKLNELKGCV